MQDFRKLHLTRITSLLSFCLLCFAFLRFDCSFTKVYALQQWRHLNASFGFHTLRFTVCSLFLAFLASDTVISPSFAENGTDRLHSETKTKPKAKWNKQNNLRFLSLLDSICCVYVAVKYHSIKTDHPGRMLMEDEINCCL